MGEIPAGWYDDGHGRRRWWDGSDWTETLQEVDPVGDQSSTEEVALSSGAELALVASQDYGELAALPVSRKFDGASERIITALRTQNDPASDPDTIWSAVGRPITGIGAGRYKLTAQMFYYEKGTLSTRAEQVHTHELYDVAVVQTMTQKARGVGTVKLRVRRDNGSEALVELTDIPNFREGVAALNEAARVERERRLLRDKTSHKNVSYSGGTPIQNAVVAAPAAALTAAAATAGPTLVEELATLARLRDQGVLDAEEFLAAKRKLLGL